MNEITITVQYVNQPKPGRKTGTIKTTGGQYYNVWPDKLHLFQPGGTYKVTYESREHEGVTYNTVKGAEIIAVGPQAAPVQSPAPTQQASQAAPAPQIQAPEPFNRAVDPTPERIYVCGITNAWVRAHPTDFNAVNLIAVTNAARQAWAETFGK